VTLYRSDYLLSLLLSRQEPGILCSPVCARGYQLESPGRHVTHRNIEWSGLEGTSVGHVVQPSCRSRVTYSRLERTLSRRVLNISREGDSTISLGSLFQGSVTLRGNKFFLMFGPNMM